MTPRPFVIALALSLVAVGGFDLLFLFNSQFAPPVALPLSLGQGQETTYPFQVPSEAYYRVELEIDRTYPFRETECLLGVGMPYPDSTRDGLRTDCPLSFYQTDVEWTLLQAGQAVRTPNEFSPHAGGYANDSIERELGQAMLRPGPPYVLQGRIVRGSSMLEKAKPRLIIVPDPSYAESGIVRTAGLLLLSVVLIVAGTILLVWEKWVRAKVR